MSFIIYYELCLNADDGKKNGITTINAIKMPEGKFLQLHEHVQFAATSCP